VANIRAPSSESSELVILDKSPGINNFPNVRKRRINHRRGRARLGRGEGSAARLDLAPTRASFLRPTRDNYIIHGVARGGDLQRGALPPKNPGVKNRRESRSAGATRERERERERES
jgi:hypothetical protein